MLFNRILITGANGLLGQELVARMSRFPEYDVLATGRDAAPRFQGGSCGYAPLDVTCHDDVTRLFQDFAPNVVVNCAAMTQVDACEEQREACWRVNVEAVEHLARQCLATGTRLIQVSTDFVFDGTDGPYREDARPKPVNFYGKSKLAAENVTRGAGLEQWAIARTVLVYGTGHDLSRSNLALWVLDVPLAGSIGVVNFVGAFVPYLGAFLGGAFAVLMGLAGGGVIQHGNGIDDPFLVVGDGAVKHSSFEADQKIVL